MFGLLGPNGAGKTTTVEILEGYRTRDAGDVSVLGHDPQRPGPRLPGAHRRRAAAVGALAERHGARDAHDVRRLLRAFARRRRGDRPRRARVEARRARQDAVRRPEAPARPRGRARRRSGPRLPRRADHRLRPGRAPRGVGDDPLAARARQDGAADDALPRRGGAAGRPRRRDARGRDRPRRHAARADDGRSRGRDPLPARRRGRRRDARPSRRACCTT